MSCSLCHAPLASQQPFSANGRPTREAGDDSTDLELAIAWLGGADLLPNSQFDSTLRNEGIVCAACHLREGRIIAPTEGEQKPSIVEGVGEKHGDVTRDALFTQSEFCRQCHQFTDEINGKPLQDTFEEWKGSVFAAAGVQCQNCHMPERRHWWRGIHDPEWVGGAIHLELESDDASASVTLVIRNAGVGHHFPTYVTPMAFVEVSLRLPGVEAEQPLAMRQIGREVVQGPDGWRELSDTRIAAQDSMQIVVELPLDLPEEAVLIARLRVEPDQMYEGIFEVLLAGESTGSSRRRIETALREARAAHYVAVVEEWAMGELKMGSARRSR